MADDTDRQPASEPPTGFPEPRGKDPGDRSHDSEPHHALNNPADRPDPTEWPDPYEQREDPRARAASTRSTPSPIRRPARRAPASRIPSRIPRGSPGRR